MLRERTGGRPSRRSRGEESIVSCRVSEKELNMEVPKGSSLGQSQNMCKSKV